MPIAWALHNEEMCALYRSVGVVRVVKCGGGHFGVWCVAGMEQTENDHRM